MTAMIKPRRCLTAQSPSNAISMPAEAAAAVSTRATARVRKYGPCRRQLERSGGRDTRSCTRCAVGSKSGGRAMDCTSVVAHLPTIRAGMCVRQLSDLTGPDSVPPVERKANPPPSPAVCARSRRYRHLNARRPRRRFRPRRYAFQSAEGTPVHWTGEAP